MFLTRFLMFAGLFFSFVAFALDSEDIPGDRFSSHSASIPTQLNQLPQKS